MAIAVVVVSVAISVQYTVIHLGNRLEVEAKFFRRGCLFWLFLSSRQTEHGQHLTERGLVGDDGGHIAVSMLLVAVCVSAFLFIISSFLQGTHQAANAHDADCNAKGHAGRRCS